MVKKRKEIQNILVQTGVFDSGNYLQNVALQTPKIQQHIVTKSCAHQHTLSNSQELFFLFLTEHCKRKNYYLEFSVKEKFGTA